MYKENASTQAPRPSNWERIEAVIKMSRMTTNAFARHIGLARGENLYQIKRGNNGISRDLANRITAKYPEVSKLWLLTGEGPMTYDDPIEVWPHIKTTDSKVFLGFAAALVLPELIHRPEYQDPYTLAVEHAKKLLKALAKEGGEQ